MNRYGKKGSSGVVNAEIFRVDLSAQIQSFTVQCEDGTQHIVFVDRYWEGSTLEHLGKVPRAPVATDRVELLMTNGLVRSWRYAEQDLIDPVVLSQVVDIDLEDGVEEPACNEPKRLESAA